MITSIDEKNLWKEIEEKNYLYLKIDTISSIKNDPTFERGETEEILGILEKNVPEIFEEEIALDYEERLDRNKWDKTYFSHLNTWLQENFAKSRIKYIKEVGKVVHADTAKAYTASLENTNKQKRENTAGNPTVAPEKPRQPQHIWGILAVCGALVLVAGLIFSLFKK